MNTCTECREETLPNMQYCRECKEAMITLLEEQIIVLKLNVKTLKES